MFAQSFRGRPPALLGPTQVWDISQTGTNLQYFSNDLGIQQAGSSTAGGSAIAITGKSAGKHYFEITHTAPVSPISSCVGVTRGSYNKIVSLATTGADDYWYGSDGRANTNGSPATQTGLTTWNSANDTVGVKLDLDAGTLDFVDRNGAAVSGFSSLPAGTYLPIAGILSGAANGNQLVANFDGSFVHGLPSGFTPFR